MRNSAPVKEILGKVIIVLEKEKGNEVIYVILHWVLTKRIGKYGYLLISNVWYAFLDYESDENDFSLFHQCFEIMDIFFFRLNFSQVPQTQWQRSQVLTRKQS